jgi:hypothetical protein
MPLAVAPTTTTSIRQPNESATDLIELMTVDDVAELLKVSRSWVCEHTRLRGTPRSDRLLRLKLGKYVRFDPHVVRAFLDRQSLADLRTHRTSNDPTHSFANDTTVDALPKRERAAL